jgi:NitT/TauT family transport system ATP-binding protein
MSYSERNKKADRQGESSLISTENLGKIYNAEEDVPLTVLENINIDISENEFVSFVGPSGCGKTTLLRIIGGLENPTNGQVFIDDRPERQPSAEKGFVFQADVVFPWRTVRENARYGPSIRGWSEDKITDRVDKFIEIVGLSGYGDYYPKQLSGGMKKRLAIAMVFANDPRILMMDEPFGSLDYVTKRNLQDELLNIWNRDQKTTLFVTHDLEEALYLSDRIYVLEGEQTGFSGIVDVPFDRPRNQDVKTKDRFINMKNELWEYIE